MEKTFGSTVSMFVVTSILFLQSIDCEGIKMATVEASTSSAVNNTADSAQKQFANSDQDSLTELFNKVKDSVVEINIVGETPNPRITIGENPLASPFGASGSGFIYDQKGNVVTNFHVIADSGVISVRFTSGYSYSAKLVGSDPINDLAVVQVDPAALSREKINPLPIANSSNVQVGQHVVALGSPEGLTNSMTSGIISQTKRVAYDLNLYRYWVGDLLQTDTDTNPGNSGGPLVNLNGELVGVSDFGKVDVETGAARPGLNFAISSNVVQRIVPQLIAEGTYSHPWIGIAVADVTPLLAEKIGLKEAVGAVVVDVTPNSPAEAAGIVAFDIIFGIDGNIIREKSDFINYMQTKASGETALLDVMGEDAIRRETTLNLGTRPTTNGYSAALITQEQRQPQKFSPVTTLNNNKEGDELYLPSNQIDLTTYENTSYGVKINYPSNWNVYAPVTDPEYRNVFIVGFEAPDVHERVAPFFEIGRDIFDRNQTLSTYVAEVIQSYRGQFSDFTLIYSDPFYASLVDNPAYSLLYTYTDEESGSIRLVKEIGTIIGETDMLYYVTYSADIPDYSLYETIVDNYFLPSLELHIKGFNATVGSTTEDKIISLQLSNSAEL